MHQAVSSTLTGNDLVKVGAIGVGNENLTEPVAGHHIDDTLHTARVELVKDVIEQQRGHSGIVGLKEVKLGKPQGDGVGLALSLAPRTAHGIVVE